MEKQTDARHVLICPQCGQLSRSLGSEDQCCWLCGAPLEACDESCIDFGEALRYAWHEGTETFPINDGQTHDLTEILQEVAPHLECQIVLLRRACRGGWGELLREEWRSEEHWQGQGSDRAREALRHYEHDAADRAAGDELVAAYDSLRPLMDAYTKLLMRSVRGAQAQ